MYEFLISLEETIGRKILAITELADIELEYNKTLARSEFEKLSKSLQ
jgi:hypothetical protein